MLNHDLVVVFNYSDKIFHHVYISKGKTTVQGEKKLYNLFFFKFNFNIKNCF